MQIHSSSNSQGFQSNADKLIQRLEGVIGRGPGKWYARCPAHDDKSPSLSVADTGDKVLIHCFAGCTSEDVLAAVELTWSDLYPDRWQAAYRRATADSGRRFAQRIDPMELERWVLRIAASDMRNDKALSAEDRARIEVACLRLETMDGEGA